MKLIALSWILLLAVLTPASSGVVKFAEDGFRILTEGSTATEEQLDGEDVLRVRLEPSATYSFVRLVPPAGSWDLTGSMGVEVQITNDGPAPVSPGVRVDQVAHPSEKAWNTADLKPIPPGQTRTIFVKFGMNFNMPQQIDPSQIAAVQIFLGPDRTEASELTISEIKAVK